MSYLHILNHSATAGVTDSCHQLLTDAQRSLFAGYGLFQGAKLSPVSGALGDNLAIDFPLSDFTVLVVSHVHINHVGRIPSFFAVDSHQACLTMVKCLVETAQATFVIVVVGMYVGGRVVDYLVCMLHEPPRINVSISGGAGKPHH